MIYATTEQIEQHMLRLATDAASLFSDAQRRAAHIRWCAAVLVLPRWGIARLGEMCNEPTLQGTLEEISHRMIACAAFVADGKEVRA